MEDAATIQQLRAIPWAAALINDPAWTHTSTTSRLPKASSEDSFIAETVATDRTIRSWLTFSPTHEGDDKLPCREVVAIMDLGSGLNGFPGVCHGGMAATLLDEICGTLIILNGERRSRRLKAAGSSEAVNASYMTAYLNTTYKKPIPTPGAILCTAKVERQDGRKLYIRATIEDGAGTTYTVGEAMFVEVKSML